MSDDKLGVKLHSTMDAKIWAEEFCKLNNCADEGMMLSWFANAIMVGHDFRARKAGKVLNFCVGLISTMDQFSGKHPEEVRQWILDEVEKL